MKTLHRTLTILIAAVWLVNGLICKVLDAVPRHGQIVASILGDGFARPLTLFIGVAEIVMALWVLSGYKARQCALLQIAIVAAMNVLEFALVPDLLLWGRFNAVFALIFIAVVYFNTFVLRPRIGPSAAP